MPPIEPPDTHFLSAASGWLGLNNLTEAKAELAQISSKYLEHPDVLEVRWVVCVEEQSWAEGLRIAQALLQCAPGRSSGWLHRAYALRRVPDGGIKKAWDALLPAFEKFPQEPIIPYNLSCYACQMRQLEAARVWLKRALLIGQPDHIKSMALQDPDLKDLWQEIPGF